MKAKLKISTFFISHHSEYFEKLCDVLQADFGIHVYDMDNTDYGCLVVSRELTEKEISKYSQKLNPMDDEEE